MIIVLITTGKHDSVDTAKVRLFEERFQAEDFCKAVSTGKCKHWQHAEIVREHEAVELCQPED